MRTSPKRENEREVRGEKNPPVVTPLFMLYCSLEMIGMKEWEKSKQFNLLARKMSQVTNLQMYTWRKTVNGREHLNLAKFKSCGAKTNKGGINLNIELRRRKARTNSVRKKHNFDDAEQIFKILEVTPQQSLAKPDKAKYDPW